MIKAYKFRLYPNKHQTELIDHNIKCCQYIYNWALAQKIQHFRETGITLTRFQLQKKLPEMKNSPETSFLKQVSSQSLQAELLNLDKAYQSFFENRKGFPKFKVENTDRQSFSVPQGVKVDYENKRVLFPKIGRIKCRLSRNLKGLIKTGTISVTKTGNYYISIIVDDELPLPPLMKIDSSSIGVFIDNDRVITCSDNRRFAFTVNNQDSPVRIRILSKKLSRKQKGSKEYEKIRLQLLNEQEKVRNQRMDFWHKISHQLTEKEITAIFINEINQHKELTVDKKSHRKLGYSISELYQLLEYKCRWKGINFIKIGEVVGYPKKCDTLNSAIALKRIGLNIYSGGVSAAEPVEQRVETEAMKQEYVLNAGI